MSKYLITLLFLLVNSSWESKELIASFGSDDEKFNETIEPIDYNKIGKIEEKNSLNDAHAVNVPSTLPHFNENERPPRTTLPLVDPVENNFSQKILELTKAEQDVRLEAYYFLYQELSSQVQTDGYLRGQWKALWDTLREPESLIYKDPYLIFCNSSTLTPFPEVEVFSRFNSIDSALENFKKLLQERQLFNASLQTSVEAVKSFYLSFKNKLRTNPHYSLVEPRVLLMGDLLPHRYYRISQSMARQLLQLDEHGNPINPSSQGESTSNHRVSFLPTQEGQEREVYFKVNGLPSLNPSREYMLSSFYQKLGIHVPLTGLLILDNVIIDGNYAPDIFVLQASQAIRGISGKRVFKEKPSLPFHSEHYSRQMVGTLLTGPVDGKPDNYIVTQLEDGTYGWVSIDNDEVFQSPVRSDNSIHLKSTLLLLPQMDYSISPPTTQFLTSFSPEVLLLEWLSVLKDQEQRYQSLKESLQFQLLRRKGGNLQESYGEEKWKELNIPFRDLYPTLIPTASTLFTKIQTKLKSHQGVTHQQLFTECYPTIAPSYLTLRTTHAQELYEGMRAFYPSQEQKAVQRSLSLGAEDPESDYFKENQTKERNESSSVEREVLAFLKMIPLKTLSSDERLKVLNLMATYWLTQASQLESQEWKDPSLLFEATSLGGNPLVLKMLVQSLGIDVNTPNEDGRTALHLAINSKNGIEQVKMLLNLGANLEAQDINKATPLDLAVDEKQEDIFIYLISQGSGKKASSGRIRRYFLTLSPERRDQLYTKLNHTNPKMGWYLALDTLLSTNKSGEKFGTITEGDKYLPASLLKEMTDDQGNIRKTNEHGRRAVPQVKQGPYSLHLKLYPELPGMEIAVSTLIRLLGYEAPYSELAELRGMPVLLTQTIPGETLYDTLQKHPEHLKLLDPYSLSMAIVMAIIMNPEDGNPTNYIVSPFVTQTGEEKYKIISIDHDHSFMPAVSKEIKGKDDKKKPSLQVKTILFLMDEMTKEIHPEVMSHFKSLNPFSILKPWLNNLEVHDQQFKAYFNSNTVLELAKSKDTVIGVPFSPGMVGHLYTKLLRLQMALSKKKVMTHFDLLKHLEPYLCLRYEKAYQAHCSLSLWERFKKVDGLFYDLANGRICSTVSLGEVLESSSIPDKETLQTALWKNTYGPRQALKELEVIEKEHTSYDEILNSLRGVDPKKSLQGYRR